MTEPSLWQDVAFRPEDRLLLYVARVSLDDMAQEGLRRIDYAALDWDRVLAQARRHEIEPLLQKGLRHLDAQAPAAVERALAGRVRQIAFRNLQQGRELMRIVRALEIESTAVIPFKGPLMGQVAYGNLAYRQFVDLDFLVRRSDFWQAKEVLTQLGYRPYREMDEEAEREYVASQLGYEFVHPEEPFVVELHWSFFFDIYAFGLEPDRVWDRQIRVPFGDQSVRSLCYEDLLIYLCAHGTKHRWLKLKWLCDVAELLRTQPSIDWPTVQQRAKAIGSERMVHLGVWLANQLLQAPVPDAIVRAAAKDRVLRDMAHQVYDDWLFCALDQPVASPAEIFWFHFRERERWRDRWPHLRHHLQLAIEPTDEDRAVVPLPQPLSFLYYLIRLFRLAWSRLKIVL